MGRAATLGSLGGLSLVLVGLLLAQQTFDRWRLSSASANVDFFTLWSVPQALDDAPGTDIYTPAGQLELGAVMTREAKSSSASETQRTATAAVRQLYDGRVDATATPFAYAVVGWLSSGDYDRDLWRFIAASWVAFAFSVVAIGALLRYSLVATLLAFLVLTSTFAPLLAELRVANLNQVQLAILAAFLLLVGQVRFGLAGVVLGLATAFKPNIALVLPFCVLVTLVDRRGARWGRLCAGAVLGMAAGLAAGALYFDGVGIWTGFLQGLERTTGVTYPLEHGNFGLAALVFSWSGWKVSWPVGLALTMAFSALVIRTRPAGSPQEPGGAASAAGADHDLHQTFLAVGLGCAVMLLASNLVWLHYYVLLIPLALFLLRPVPERAPDRTRRLACGGAAVASLVLFSSAAQYLAAGAGPAATLANVATLLLFGAGLDELWRLRRARAASDAGTAARRPGSRARLRPKLGAIAS